MAVDRPEPSDWLVNVLPGVTSIEGLTRLSGGASRETWSFEADGRRFILQRAQPGATRNMAVEADVVRAAHAVGVPVAEVLASGSDPEGRSFIVSDFKSGETIARKLLRDEPYGRARRVLVPQAASALAALHSIDSTTVAGLEHLDPLVQWRDTLDLLNRQLSQAHPAFELAFRWLEANRPGEPGDTRRRVSVVHGDFRLGNLMVDPDGLVAVLDWELAHLGDPAEDLGWLCVRAWRFGSRQPVAGMGDYDQLIDAYNEACSIRGSEASVTRDQVRWWEVLGTLKWGIMCMIQVSSHLLGHVRSHEHAAIGRRVCENEYDLLTALEGAWGSMGVDR